MSEPRAVVPEVIGDDAPVVTARRRRLRRLAAGALVLALVALAVVLNDQAARRREVNQLLDATVHAEQLALDVSSRGSLTDTAPPNVTGVLAVDVRPWHSDVRHARRLCVTYVMARVAYLAEPRREPRPDDERRLARTALTGALPAFSDELHSRVERVLRDS